MASWSLGCLGCLLGAPGSLLGAFWESWVPLGSLLGASWFPPLLRCVVDAPPQSHNVRKSLSFSEVWKRVSEIRLQCVFGLHRHDRIACAPFSKRGQRNDHTEWFVFIFLRTCSQDGRSGVQGVSKGCLTSAPEDPNVAPAVPNVAHGAAKVAAGVSQGAQREPKAWPRAPTRCPREPKGCPWCSLGCLLGASWKL